MQYSSYRVDRFVESYMKHRRARGVCAYDAMDASVLVNTHPPHSDVDSFAASRSIATAVLGSEGFAVRCQGAPASVRA